MYCSTKIARVERLGTDEGAAAALVLLAAAAAAYKGRRRRRRAGDGCIFGQGWGLNGSLFSMGKETRCESSRNMCPLKISNHGAKGLMCIRISSCIGGGGGGGATHASICVVSGLEVDLSHDIVQE